MWDVGKFYEDDEELDRLLAQKEAVSSPMPPPPPPPRRVVVPVDVPQPDAPQLPEVDVGELQQARDADEEELFRQGIGDASRRILQGLTHTRIEPYTKGPANAEARVMDANKAARAEALKRLEIEMRGEGFDPELERQKLDLRRKELDSLDTYRKGGVDEREAERQRRAAKDAADADYRAKLLALKAKKGSGPHKPTTAERRQAMRENALKPRDGWEPIVADAPVFRSPQQAEKFDAAEAAFGALQNHRAHAAEAMKKFHAAKTVKEKDAALAVVNQQMANIASKLRVAEGLNNTDAANHAVDTMLSLTNGSVVNLRNMANEGRLDAILNSAIESAQTNLDTLAKSNNLRRAKGGGSHEAAGPKTVSISNGKETLQLEDPTEEDLAEAEAEGYRRVD